MPKESRLKKIRGGREDDDDSFSENREETERLLAELELAIRPVEILVIKKDISVPLVIGIVLVSFFLGAFLVNKTGWVREEEKKGERETERFPQDRPGPPPTSATSAGDSHGAAAEPKEKGFQPGVVETYHEVMRTYASPPSLPPKQIPKVTRQQVPAPPAKKPVQLQKAKAPQAQKSVPAKPSLDQVLEKIRRL